GFAHEVVEELRSLIPPMAEQFRIVGREDERRAIHDSSQVLHLADSFLQEMASVIGGDLERGLAVVNALLSGTGDGVIFDAGKGSLALDWHVGLDVIVIEIESDIAVEVAIARIAGIAFILAPDLAG